MAPSKPQIIFGTAGIASWGDETALALLDVLPKHGVKALDTAFLYSQSEATIGRLGASKKFSIDTKAPGFGHGRLSKQSILDGMESSLKDLGVDSVDVYYFHSPDPSTPLEESLSAIDGLHAAGKFKRFGVSNFLPSDVQKIYDIQKSKNSVLPTVYQGNYNAVSRHIEDDLFPLLRKLGISFYAYSPIAGGFLVKESADIRNKSITDGRFSGKTSSAELYDSLYAKETLLKALDEWGAIAKDAGISRAALAYRWIVWHSGLKFDGTKGDGVIVGARKTEQLEETLKAIEEGPLGEGVAEKVEGIWEAVKAEAPRDNWHSFYESKGGV